MLRRTHLVFSIFIYFLLYNYIQQKIIFLIFLLLATIIIDIDSKKSKIGNHLILRPLQWFISHRGIFHTILFGAIVSVILYLVNKQAGLGFALGYACHLFLDSFTRSGIKLFFPLSNKKIGLGLKTGGILEEILFVLLLLMDIFLLIKLIL